MRLLWIALGWLGGYLNGVRVAERECVGNTDGGDYPAIRTVLAAYRSTSAQITREQMEAAWAEYEELRRR